MLTIASMRGGLSAQLNDVRVDRASVLGNPFELVDESQRDAVIEAYGKWLWQNVRLAQQGIDAVVTVEGYGLPVAKAWKKPSSLAVMAELKRIKELVNAGNVRLICWCAPKRCHAEMVKRCVEWM